MAVTRQKYKPLERPSQNKMFARSFSTHQKVIELRKPVARTLVGS